LVTDPVISAVDVPRGAEPLAVIVITLLPVVGFGLNVAVTPAGSWGAVKITALAKSPFGTTVTVATAEPFGTIEKGTGETLRKKSGSSTVNAIVVVAVKAPEVPVMVTMLRVFEAAVLSAVSVRTLLPVAGFDNQDAVTPLGSPDVTARLTLPVNPA